MIDDVAHNIMNERRGPPDRNPLIDCADCGESFRWRDYWKPRVEAMDDPRAEPWRCDECQARRERRVANRQLASFAGETELDDMRESSPLIDAIERLHERSIEGKRELQELFRNSDEDN